MLVFIYNCMSSLKVIESVPVVERHEWDLYNHGFNTNNINSKSLPCGFMSSRLFDVKADKDVSVSEHRYDFDNKYRHADQKLDQSLHVNTINVPNIGSVRVGRLSVENVSVLENSFSDESELRKKRETYVVEELNQKNSMNLLTNELYSSQKMKLGGAIAEAASIIAPPAKTRVQQRIVIEGKKKIPLRQTSMLKRLVTTNIREERLHEEEHQLEVERETIHVDTVVSPAYGFGVPSAFSSCGSLSADFLSDHSAQDLELEGDWSSFGGDDVVVGPKTAPVRGWSDTPETVGRPTSTSVTSLIHKLRKPVNISNVSPGMIHSTVTATTSASVLQAEDLELGIFVDECPSASAKISLVDEDTESDASIPGNPGDLGSKFQQKTLYDGSMGDSTDASMGLDSVCSGRESVSLGGDGISILARDTDLEITDRAVSQTGMSVMTGADTDLTDSVTELEPDLTHAGATTELVASHDCADTNLDSKDHFKVIQPSIDEGVVHAEGIVKGTVDYGDGTGNLDRNEGLFRGADWSQHDDNEEPYESETENEIETPNGISRMPTDVERTIQDSVGVCNLPPPDVLLFKDRSTRVSSPTTKPRRSISYKYSNVNGRYIPPTHVAMELIYETLEIPFYNSVTGLQTDVGYTSSCSEKAKCTVLSAIGMQEKEHSVDNYKTWTSHTSIHAVDTSFEDFSKLIAKTFGCVTGSFVEDSLKSQLLKREKLEQLYRKHAVRAHKATNLPLIDAPCAQSASVGLVGSFAATGGSFAATGGSFAATDIVPDAPLVQSIHPEDLLARPNTAGSVLSIAFPSIENLSVRPRTSHGEGVVPLTRDGLNTTTSATTVDPGPNLTGTSTFNNYKEETVIATAATTKNVNMAIVPPNPYAWNKSMSCITEKVCSRPSTGFGTSRDVLRLAASGENLLSNRDGFNTVGKLKFKNRSNTDISLAERIGPGLNLANCAMQTQDYYMLQYYHKGKNTWIEVDSELSYAHMILYGLDIYGVYEDHHDDSEALRVMIVSIPHKPLSYEECMYACDRNSINEYVPKESREYIKKMGDVHVDRKALWRSKFHKEHDFVQGASKTNRNNNKTVTSKLVTPHTINGMFAGDGILRPVTAPESIRAQKAPEDLSACSVTMTTIRCKTGGKTRKEHEQLIESNMRATSPKMPTLVPRGRLISTTNNNTTTTSGHSTNSMNDMKSLFAPGIPVSIATYHRNGFTARTKPKLVNYIKKNSNSLK